MDVTILQINITYNGTDLPQYCNIFNKFARYVTNVINKTVYPVNAISTVGHRDVTSRIQADISHKIYLLYYPLVYFSAY